MTRLTKLLNMRVLTRVINYLLLAGIFIAWVLTAYSRSEDPNGEPSVIPINEGLWEWIIRASTTMIYFMLSDLINALRLLRHPLDFVQKLLIFWHERTPWLRMAILLYIANLAASLIEMLKEKYAAIKSKILPRNQPDSIVQPTAKDKKNSLPTVFISYSHDSEEHKQRIRKLADRLKGDRINCDLDQDKLAVHINWKYWTKEQIAKADFVLIACTEEYRRRSEQREDSGVKWESDHIKMEIDKIGNRRFVPVIFSSNDIKHIPEFLDGPNYFNVNDEEDKNGYENLRKCLTLKSGQNSDDQ